LADDNEQMLEYVRELLTAEGCEVVGAVGNGQTAVKATEELRPDIVFLDVSMPVLNGIQAAKRLREAHPDAKIVFLTIFKDRDICRAALEAGALGYVLKERMGADLIPALNQARLSRHFVSPGCEPDVLGR
jgi:DNA-binding NarL/FixJ family response regulator